MRSRSNFLLLIVLAFIQAAFAAPAFADAEASAPQQGAAIQVHGDSVEYFHETEKVVGTGNVSIDYEGAKLTADKITVNLKDKVAVAEGNVVLTQNGSVFKGNRLSTIEHADRILVLEKGKMVEEGNHTQLLRKKGLYYAFWRQQSGNGGKDD
jgi:lipopolysaccharide export system protein LptA